MSRAYVATPGASAADSNAVRAWHADRASLLRVVLRRAVGDVEASPGDELDADRMYVVRNRVLDALAGGGTVYALLSDTGHMTPNVRAAWEASHGGRSMSMRWHQWRSWCRTYAPGLLPLWDSLADPPRAVAVGAA